MGRGYLGNQAMTAAIRNAPSARQTALRNAIMGLLSSGAQSRYPIPNLPQYQRP
jgi:hypothetical protein